MFFKMRKCVKNLRFFHPRDSKWRTFLQIVSIVGAVALLFIFMHEKYEKDALIELALGSRNVDELVRPDNDTLVINGLLMGPNSKLKGKSPFIVIAVTSHPGNSLRRTIIRNTWANKVYENYGAGVIFFLGKPSSQEEMHNLMREAELHKDLIVDDFEESYYALSIKTLRVMKYFKFYHPKSKFLVKTDDDVFVNVRNLVHYCFEQNQEFERKFHQQEEVPGNDVIPKPFFSTFHFLAGVIHSDRSPHTWNSFSKWYAPSKVWSSVFSQVKKLKNLGKVATAGGGDRTYSVRDSGESEHLSEQNGLDIRENIYPPYAEGNFYIISDDAAVDILEASRNVPLYHLEDVYVTGVIATWVLEINKENMPYISSASNVFPRLSYWWYTVFTPPEELIAFHCDNNVELVTTIYHESVK